MGAAFLAVRNRPCSAEHHPGRMWTLTLLIPTERAL